MAGIGLEAGRFHFSLKWVVINHSITLLTWLVCLAKSHCKSQEKVEKMLLQEYYGICESDLLDFMYSLGKV